MKTGKGKTEYTFPESGREMIGMLVRRMLAAQVLSALTVSLCLLIDNIMIGRFLGVAALAAYGLANPILLVIGAVGSLLSAGVQVACSRSLGKGMQEETNAGYSTAVVAAAVFSAAFVALVALLRVPLARLMGASEPGLLSDTSSYMAGFIIGAPATMSALILVPFLQIAGQSSLLIAAVLGMTAADVAFDLLSVFVFNGGMFGMGLASSLSYYVAMVIGGGYFLSKKCVFKFSFAGVRREKLRELLAGGAPTMVGMASSVALVFAMNKILMGTGGDAMVAAFSVISTIGNASNCISTGTGGVALTLSSMFYNEEDRTSLRSLLGEIARAAAVLGAAAMALLLIFAPACVRLFIPEAGASQRAAVFGLRAFSLGLIPCCLNNALKSSYQGTGRVGLMEILSLLENVTLPVAAALAARCVAGVPGVWFYFFAGEALTLAGVMGWVWIQKRAVTWQADDVLLLRSGFGVPPEDLLETDIHSINDVMTASRAAEAFCRAHGGDDRLSTHMALCVEEMGTNIVTHGFAPNGKNRLSIRLQRKDNRWTLRFRDDCMAFDPVSHVSQHTSSDSIGIRLAMRVADEARYTYSMNLNNLTLILRQE